MDKGYKILDIYEVYEYQITQYNPETDAGGLFVDYINTFLKLKVEASVYPCWVRSPEDEERYSPLGRVRESNWIRHLSSITL